MKKILSVLLTLTLVVGLLSGCDFKTDSQTGNNSSDGANTPVKVDFSKTDADMFTDRDFRYDYDQNTAVNVTLNGTTATADDQSVKISGSKITITKEATYVISGELNDGMLIIDAEDNAKIQLVLKGVNITSKTSAALYILSADKAFVTLAEGTSNTLANGGSFEKSDANIDAALFSKQDLTLGGTGSLTLTSPAGHGIVCKDDLVITGGAYAVNCASHGLNANDSVRITNATIEVDSGKDAIHCENDDTSKGFIYISGGSIKAEAEGDGISAGAHMQISGGSIDLLVGGGSENSTKEHSDFYGGFMGGRPGTRPDYSQSNNSDTEEADTSMKGLKSANSMLISNGNITINSADDAIHSDISLTVNGGNFTIKSGDDAIHAEETLTVTAGNIEISESYEGLEAMHLDLRGGNITLKATDDGLNAAGGKDESGTTGGRDGMFGGGFAGPGGMGPGGMSQNSNGSIKISGGTLYINSSGDGMDANGTLEISGGHITVTGPTQGDTATLDYDKTGVITGGTFIGTGSTMMAQSFSDSNQGVIALNIGNRDAKTQITLKDSKGNIIISHQPELDFAVVIISTPELVKGEEYTLTVGSQTGKFEAA